MILHLASRIFRFLHPFPQFSIKRMVRQCCHVSYNHKFHPRTCHRHIHSTQLFQKTNLSRLIGSYKADNHHITLLPLKSVDGIDRDIFPEWLQKFRLFNKMPQKVDLLFVRRDDSKINLLFFHSVRTNLLYKLSEQC